MLPLVEIPEIVQHYASFFQDAFSPEALIEFERYLSGLIVSENKTVEGINRLFVVESRNQSSLNRLLTASPYALDSLNQARLHLLDSLPGTRIKPRGVLSIDNTLLTHFGQDFEQIALLWDHVSQSYVWAHDLLTIHYSDDDTDYPLLFELWKPVDLDKLEQGLRQANIPLKAPKEALKTSDPPKWRAYLQGVYQRQLKKHPQIKGLYDSKLTISLKLLQDWVEAHPDLKLPVTFDRWFTQPAYCRHLDQSLKLAYVGTLEEKDQVILKTGELLSLKDFAARLKEQQLQALQNQGRPVFRQIQIPYQGEQETYFSYCNTHRLHNFGKQRLVINYRQADCKDKPTFFISNRLYWQAPLSPASAATAGPLKSIMRKARPKGWTSINYASLMPSNAMLPWWP